jgi:hypothetical protein
VVLKRAFNRLDGILVMSSFFPRTSNVKLGTALPSTPGMGQPIVALAASPTSLSRHGARAGVEFS